MIQDIKTLTYLTGVIGKPILAIFNSEENRYYYYLLESYKMYNPSNYLFENSVTGKNIDDLVKSIKSFAAGSISNEHGVILTKIESISTDKFNFSNDFKWILINV